MKRLILALTVAALGIIPARAVIIDSSTETISLANLNGVLPADFTTTGAAYKSGALGTAGGYYTLDTGLVYQPSSSGTSGTFSLTSTFQNSLGSTITSLTFSYDAYIAVTRSSRSPAWTVTSDLGDVSALNWSSATDGAQTKTVTLTGLSIAPGTTFSFTFASDRGLPTGSSSAIGMNNFVIKSVTAVPEPGTVAMLVLGAGMVGIVYLRRRQAAAPTV